MKHNHLAFLLASPLAIAIATATAANGAPETEHITNHSCSLPEGGQVIGGQATITQHGNAMDVNTSTHRTTINWQRFNVGPDNKVTFIQPDGKSITLNRVLGGDPSKIYGALTSNGQLILVNPNGIMFGPNAHVSSSALVASAGFLTEEQARQFAETGKLDIHLTGNVTNQGCITVHDNGMVALLGAQVNNAGVIEAHKGMVQLATGPQAALDFYGDGLLNIAIAGEPGEKNSVNADVKGGVHNSGEIDVGNGTVAMSAARAAKHLDSVINIGGAVIADSVTNDGGTIVLANSAQTAVTGQLSAKGVNGGEIRILGDEVTVAGNAQVDASGTQAAGGKVLVGGSYQGKGSEPAASRTTVAEGAQLKADGKTDGGQVVVWSDGKTHFAGSASAQGERKGGVVETSGKQLTIAPQAQVNASGGQASGKWLLDPETVNIEAEGGAPGSDTVAASAIASGLKNSDVEISASQRINVNSAVIAQDAGYHTLYLQADGTAAPVSVYKDTGDPFADAKRNDSGSVYINAPILLQDGHLYIAASGDVLLNNPTGSQSGDAGYLGRAIIDVGNGTIWIKTSNSASVIQQQGTALIGKNVAVEGASVLLDSPLNHAGTLAGKASNGKFIYNQTSSDGVHTGKVQVTHDRVTETQDGVSASAIAKLGEHWMWERTGEEPHHLTIDESTPFQYLVFEALEYVDHKNHQPIAGDKTDSDYWVSSLTFKNPTTGDVWVVSSNPAVASGISVTRNGEATSELPPGFALGTPMGSVTASTQGWGVTDGKGDQGHEAASNAINRNGAENASDQLVVDLGSSTSSVDAEANDLWHSGNKYESGVVSFLGTKDTSQDGGVTLKSQTAQLEGKIADAQREYGDANPDFTASVGLPENASENSKAVKGVDDFVDRQLKQDRFDVKVTPSTEATASSDVGDYTVGGSIDASGYAGQRYQASVKEGTLHVTPAELTVTANDKQKVYGDADPALDYSVSGAKLGQTGEQLLNGGALVRQPGENVGNYGIEQGELALNNGLGGNYTLTFVDGQLQITQATLDVTAQDKSKVYGEIDPALTYVVSGLKNGDTREQVLSDGTVKREAGENVGTYGITNDSLALLSNNYILQFHDGVFSITPADLTVTAKDKSKVYGDADPKLTFEVSGLKRGDTATSVLNAGTLERESGENVGQYGIHQGTLDLNGQAGQNYVLHYVDGDFYITPATLTVDADGKTKVYGDFDPALTYSVSGLKNGDAQADVLAGALSRAEGENVGTYAIGQGSLDLTSGKGQNYVLSFSGDDFTITPASLTVSADSKTKVYGDLDPKLTYNVTGLKNGDSQAEVLNGGALVRAPGENVGDYAIGQGELGLGEGKGSNYVLSFVDGNLAITPATLTVEAQDKSKVYGDADPTLTYVVSGLKNGDSAASVVGGELTREAGENVGNYGIINDSLALLSNNYVLQFHDGVFSITPAELTVTANDQSKVYGDADPKLTFEVSGLKRGDTATSVLNAGTLERDAGENVGQYGVHQGTLDLNGQAGQNYVLHYVDGDFYITPATLTVDADGKTKVYGDFDPALTYSVSGLKNGDARADVLAGALSRAEGENVGTYAIGQGSLDLTSGKGQNYVLSFTGDDFTITPASLIVTADSTTKVYGDLDPKLTYSVAGLKNGDSQTEVLNGGALSRAPGENVGDYAIGQGELGLGEGKGGNYVLSFVDGNLAITPATLTVEAQDKGKVYGDADPTLTYVVAGLKNGDTAASVVSGELTREAGENVTPEGYAITQGTVELSSGNYRMVFKDGKLQVSPAELTVTADNKTKVQGEKDPALTYSVSGLKRGDSADVVKGQLKREPGEAPGQYAIGQDGSLTAGNNYTVTFEGGTLTITGPLAPDPLPPLPVTAQSPGNTRCTAVESPSAVSANYSISPAVIRTYAVQLVCKPRSYGDTTSTVPTLLDVLSYANSRFENGKFIVPDWNRTLIPNELSAPTQGGK